MPVQRPAPTRERRHSDEQELLTGYLAAVAMRLDQRGIAVHETRATTLATGALTGWMALTPVRAGGRWAPIRLDWREDTGWSATLAPPAEQAAASGHDDRVPRYLPGKLVPAPTTVAHFVAALIADEAAPWASAIYRQPRRIDRRLLILRLSQFGLPEPW
ncbi:DUF6292 family protein [Pseudonocardia eucalypti]|uniref:DUF6292 family protein n=1 Tax=Pseudonocardia eucalypti TaxID=648755 RepID=UPI0031E53821